MKNLKIILVFMTLALLGLVAFQWYWVNQAIAIKEEQFDRKVQEALNQTTLKIEKQEAIYLAKQRLSLIESKKINRLLNNPKKPPPRPRRTEIPFKDGRFTDVMQGLGLPNDRLISEKSFHDNQLKFFKEFLKQQKEVFENITTSEKENIKKQELIDSLFNKSNDIFESTYLTINDEASFIKSENKKALVQNVFSDMININKSLFERLNKSMLDTLLRQELQNKGINIDFEYGVTDKGKFAFTSFGLSNNLKLPETAYKARLFPNDALIKNQFINLYFPNKQGFILGNLWSVFGTSFLLLMGIGAIFYKSVSTILEQKKLSDMKTDFINNMTHELKTPISTIQLAVDLISNNEIQKNQEQTNRYLNIIKDENKRLENHVEKVLQIAQLEKNGFGLTFEEININELIKDVVNNIAVQIQAKEGTIHLDLDPTNLSIFADETHITNVITNLLDNALKYSPQKPIITIKTDFSENGLQLQISDEGIGMSGDEIKRIFEKFYRVPTGNLHDVKGFGLGLSYVNNIINTHNGTITVESKLGKGSTFAIYLPFKNTQT